MSQTYNYINVVNREVALIPKIIHYCWFGGRPLPELALKCIDSWKKYCPDYEIKEWNEGNYNVSSCAYARQAYEAGKWAFVSDYARFDILYQYGGLYFDTDVELIKPIDDLVERGAFMGCEPSRVKDDISVAAGLGLAAEPGCRLYKEIVDDYRKADFIKENDSGNYVTVVHRVSAILKRHGLTSESDIQLVDGVLIYPPQYFCPLDYTTGKLHVTRETCSIHWYKASWMSRLDRKITRIEQRFADCGKVGHYLERTLTLPLRVVNKVKKIGIGKSVRLIVNRFCSGVEQTSNGRIFRGAFYVKGGAVG